MDFYCIRLKNRPHLFVRKDNSTYAMYSDYNISNFKPAHENIDKYIDAYWFVSAQRAKVWTELKALKRFVSLRRHDKNDTYSEYEVVKNGTEILNIDSL